MQSGEMNQRITLQRRARTSDGMGGYTESWSDIVTAWARVVPVRSRSEIVDGQRIAPLHQYRATLRWRQDESGAPYYTTADRVVWRGRTHGIESVSEPRDAGRRALIEITMTEGEAS